MSWYQLLDIIQSNSDPSFRGEDVEAMTCANDGEPFSQGPDGSWFCRFDGSTPDRQRTGPGRYSSGS